MDPASSTLAGLIQPGSHVDVIYTRPGNATEAITTTLLEDVKVLSYGRQTQIGQVIDPKLPKMPVATLVVNPEQAQRLELAKNEGKVSLTLRNPLDKKYAEGLKPMGAEALDPDYQDRLDKALRRAGMRTAADIQKALTDAGPKPVAPVKIVKAEPPPPRAIVDVYRGEKHVQEVFHD